MHVAVDLGAESVRVIAGRLEGSRLRTEELLRFRHQPVQLADRLAWDLEGILAAVQGGLAKAREARSVGVDGWGVDFGLLRDDGSPVAPPRSYRDPLTAGILPRLFEAVPADHLYARTGIQMMEINTICQLLALRLAGAPELAAAAQLVLIPDLILHRLGAGLQAERTNASTTQLLAAQGDWARDLFDACGLAAGLAPPLVAAGREVGRLDPKLGLGGARLVTVGSHDTASAVVAVPFEPGRPAAFISSGTWSLVGVELAEPVLTEAARLANLSNEEGVEGRTRLLRNVMGLWLLQRCCAAWGISYQDAGELAAGAPAFGDVFDPDHPSLLRAADMPAAVAALLPRAPADRAALLRAVFDSLALRYRWVLESLAAVIGMKPEAVHVVGGGARNRLLCQLTADCCGIPVLAGPVEATAIGNLAVQLVGLGQLRGLDEVRELVRASAEPRRYDPRPEGWDERYERFEQLLLNAPASR